MPSLETTALAHQNLTRLFTTLLVVALLTLVGGPAAAFTEADEPESTTTDADPESAEAELLRNGAEVYSQICASCHQAGGVGLVGQFPPLIDNPNVDDASYVEGVITGGRQGELEVAGVTYNGIMPSFSTLSDEDTTAVVAYVQNDFVAPAAAITPSLGPVAGTELPALANITYLLTFAIVAALLGLVLAPRIMSNNDRLHVPWLDAWLKTAVIVAAVILLTVIIPNWAIRQEAVTGLSSFAQDLVGVSLWMFGMVVVVWSLWYAHRRSRV